MLVHGRDASALHARFPSVLFRFQRREGYRVRPAGHAGPELQWRLNDPADTELTLRVLDLSHGGVALFLPEGAPVLAAGTQIPAARLILEPGTHVQVSVRVVRTEKIDEPQQGQRVGCEIAGLSGVAARTLQRYIDQTQMRHRLLSV
jgi:c-di-GMP-binding flagellar brake protein YcgR